MKLAKRLAVLVVLGALVVACLVVGPASASSGQFVRCVGDADYCGATVSLAGGARNRVVTVMLSGTNLKLAGTWGTPAEPGGSFTISNGRFRLGGSEYQFTLNARRSNPRRSRLVLLFHAGRRSPGPPGVQGTWVTTYVTLRFPSGHSNITAITGGGEGTSNCTREEKAEGDGLTTSDAQTVKLTFFGKADGVCGTERRWSWFRVRVYQRPIREPGYRLVGSGTIFVGQTTYLGDYVSSCLVPDEPWVGVSCRSEGEDGQDNSDLVIEPKK